jgi:thiosulfate dehydrogenase [quinone] large subunit
VTVVDALRGALRRPHVALLPLRFAFGATFLYAGLDKILDPTFLQPAGRGSIGADLGGYVQVSPIGWLIAWVVPLAVPLGLGIALAEICVGLGALLGLAFRLTAFGGMLLSGLFFLTASWAVRPFYLGNDLPYAFGWLTLALAGHGGILALDDVLARRWAARAGRDPSAARWADLAPGRAAELPAGARAAASPLLHRRSVLKVAALGVLAVSVAGVSTLVEAALGRRAGASGGPGGLPTPEPTSVAGGPLPSPSTAPSITPSVGPTPVPTPSPSPTPSPGKVIARIADVTTSHPVVFQDPYTSDPGVLLRLKDGRFVAFDAVCTHAACTVEFESATGYLVCPCHGAVFDPARDAKPIDGPTFFPLMPFPIEVDQAGGTIRLIGE